MSQKDASAAQTIFTLLKDATTQAVVKDFLKSKGVPISAQNWDDLFTRRVQPALAEGVITVAELRALLQEAEEYGRQHTFLFSCDAQLAKQLIAKARVERVAQEHGLLERLTEPLDLVMPEVATIVDIRIGHAPGENDPRELVVKVVETRTKKKFLGEHMDLAAGRMTKTYAVEEKRAVNVVHLHSNGLLELRVASQDNQTRYLDNVRALRYAARHFLTDHNFTPVSLSKAKKTVLRDRERLASEIRYSHSAARNDFGNEIKVSSGSQEDTLSTDSGSMGALETFLANEGHVTGASIYVKISGSDPAREIHLLMSGEINEFAVPVSCTSGDYAYVLGKILAFNR